MEPQRTTLRAPAHLRARLIGPSRRNKRNAFAVTGGGSAPHRCRNRGGGRSDRVQQSPPRAPAAEGHDLRPSFPGSAWERTNTRLRLVPDGGSEASDRETSRRRRQSLPRPCVGRRDPGNEEKQCRRPRAGRNAPAACGLPTRGDGPPSSQAVAHRLHCRMKVDSALGPTGE